MRIPNMLNVEQMHPILYLNGTWLLKYVCIKEYHSMEAKYNLLNRFVLLVCYGKQRFYECEVFTPFNHVVNLVTYNLHISTFLWVTSQRVCVCLTVCVDYVCVCVHPDQNGAWQLASTIMDVFLRLLISSENVLNIFTVPVKFGHLLITGIFLIFLLFSTL